ncbi:hypothetical protein ONZ45_g8965 [Pleurotus djamor]|nr:hypothetical protein ONZ45_g8965 [Pleurotus djamor]
MASNHEHDEPETLEDQDQFLDQEEILVEYAEDGDEPMDEDDDDEYQPRPLTDVDTTSLQLFAQHKGSVFTVHTHPTEPIAATGGEDDLGYLWDTSNGEVIAKLTGHSDSVTAIRFSHDGEMVASGGMDGKVRIWRRVGKDHWKTWEFLTELQGPDEVMFLRWHPKGHVLLAGSNDGMVWLWQLPSGNTMQVLSGHLGPVQCGEFTPDGKRIITACSGGDVIYWDPRSDAPIFKVQASKARDPYEVTSLAVNSSSSLAVAGCSNGQVLVINLTKGDVVTTLAEHSSEESVEAIAFAGLTGSASGPQVLLTGGTDGKICVWDTNTWRLRGTLNAEETITTLLPLPSPNNYYVVAASTDQSLKTWDLSAHILIFMLPHEHPDRRRPQVAIPPGARPPVNPTIPSFPVPQTPWAFELSPPPYQTTHHNQRPVTSDGAHGFDRLANPWDNASPSTPQASRYNNRPFTSDGYNFAGARPESTGLSRTTSMFESGAVGAGPVNGNQNRMVFPEPELYRSVSSGAPGSLTPHSQSMRHSRSRSDLQDQQPQLNRMRNQPSMVSLVSTASSYNAPEQELEDQYYSAESSIADTDADDLSKELAKLTMDADENLLHFQQGKLQEKDQEWHKLIPEGAQEALGKQEVQRQSVIFEVIKSEADYVADLLAVQEVFIHGLRSANPPIIRPEQLEPFITDVFNNVGQILQNHQRMVAALFARQRDQHPLIQSIADVVLDAILLPTFRDAYIPYIKHYPLAESRHRRELKRNKAYESFIRTITSASPSSFSTDPLLKKLPSEHLAKIRKRDVITFLSRPVTRLPRLNLLLGEILKLTQKGDYEDHPDLQTLPIILGIVGDFVRETQPGIEAAEAKVKFWTLCEKMRFRAGEILNLDLYDDSRTLVYEGPIARRGRSDTGFSTWLDQSLALLDNYLLINQEQKDRTGATIRVAVSRPLHLSYLRLASFNDPPETRREKAEDNGGLFDSLKRVDIPLYPFTVYHASSRSTRRYTFYVQSEALRKKWYNVLVDAMGVNKVREEASMWFVQEILSDKFFHVLTADLTHLSSKITGRITAAAPFSSGGRKYVAVGCMAGIFVAPKGEENYRRVLAFSNPTSVAVLQSLGQKTFNKLLVHHEASIYSYSLDLLARVAQGQASPQALDASMERVAGSDSNAGTGNVLFFRTAKIGNRMLVIYASKRTLSISLSLNVLEAIDIAESNASPRRTNGSLLSFRALGESGYIPKDAHDVTVLTKTIGVCTKDGIVVADPMNVAKSAISVIPDFSKADPNTNKPMADLKQRTDEAKPLGIVRSDEKELLVVYDTLGCYISKHGEPLRKSGYVKWETQASSFAHRGPHILLFSASFIEIREIESARLVQVIEATDIRLLYKGPVKGQFEDTILVAMRSSKDHSRDMLITLEETVEIQSNVTTPSSSSSVPANDPGMWADWDM